MAIVWWHYFDKERDKVQTRPDQGTEAYTRVNGTGKRYQYLHRDAEVPMPGHLVTVGEQEDGTLKVQDEAAGALRQPSRRAVAVLIDIRTTTGAAV